MITLPITWSFLHLTYRTCAVKEHMILCYFSGSVCFSFNFHLFKSWEHVRIPWHGEHLNSGLDPKPWTHYCTHLYQNGKLDKPHEVLNHEPVMLRPPKSSDKICRLSVNFERRDTVKATINFDVYNTRSFVIFGDVICESEIPRKCVEIEGRVRSHCCIHFFQVSWYTAVHIFFVLYMIIFNAYSALHNPVQSYKSFRICAFRIEIHFN